MDCVRHGDRTRTTPPARSERSKTTCQASTPMKKRTKHGHFGQSTDRSAAGEGVPRGKQSDCRLRRGGSDLAPARCLPDSRAVRALSEVTVLCPFLDRRNYQNQITLNVRPCSLVNADTTDTTCRCGASSRGIVLSCRL